MVVTLKSFKIETDAGITRLLCRLTIDLIRTHTCYYLVDVLTAMHQKIHRCWLCICIKWDLRLSLRLGRSPILNELHGVLQGLKKKNYLKEVNWHDANSLQCTRTSGELYFIIDLSLNIVSRIPNSKQ